MDDQKVGRIVRALRRRLDWRQEDLAAAAGTSQSEVSLIERGRLDRVSLPVLRRVLAALDATLSIEVRWRAGALDRLLDEQHAVIVGMVGALLSAAGWEVLTEVTYSEFGERGSFDLLAWHAESRTLLVVEVKTDIVSAEATLRKLDEKGRLAATVAGKRFGWKPLSVSRLLVVRDGSTNRRRVARHEALFWRALPARSVECRRWVARPSGTLAGLWFLSPTRVTSGIRGTGGPERVRRPEAQSVSRVTSE